MNRTVLYLFLLTVAASRVGQGGEFILRGSFAGYDGPPRCFAISPDGKKIVTGGVGDAKKGSGKFGYIAEVRIFEFPKGKKIAALDAHENTVLAAAFSPDGKYLVTGGADQVVKVFNFEKRSLVRTLEGHTDVVYRVAISPDGTKVASASYDGTARLWELATGKLLHNLDGHGSDQVSAIAFSPDGASLATGGWDRKVQLWNVASGKSQGVLEGHTGWVISVEFSPNGNKLASGAWGRESEAILWDVKVKKKEFDLDAATAQGAYVRFTPDGKRLLSAGLDSGLDGTLKRWLIATGKEEAATPISGLPWGLEVTRDGKTAVLNASEEMQIWDIGIP